MTADGTTIVDDFSIITDTNQPCTSKNATTILHLKDVDCNITVKFSLSVECYMQLSFELSPRSHTVGNLWIGMGIDKTINHTFSDTHAYDMLNSRSGYLMNGNALIVSLFATINETDSSKHIPLNDISYKQVKMNAITRTANSVKKNFFNCHDQLDNIDGKYQFKCSKSYCPTCN
eukprot:422241_1